MSDYKYPKPNKDEDEEEEEKCLTLDLIGVNIKGCDKKKKEESKK